ncbi:glycoside hydrolase family 127 protein [Olivibacter sitiensis]|uniref:glycoside hydrolase family 127 protein n=1 Tax=Olivibacter sitiensis TaxID=376470 RepID=UPI0004084A56|nr:glycoside hydrolase family 127 protein [Olivibacter sitiensis]
MKKYLFLFLSISPFVIIGQTKRLSTFSLEDVRLTESPFSEAQETDRAYIMKLDPDRLLAPFRKEADLAVRKESYGNWESTGLDGHIGGHYLSALANMYASTADSAIGKRLEYMISELADCQKSNGNGYVGGIPDGKALWKEIAEGKIEASSFSLNGKWVPWYNIHKLYAGLCDAYLLAHNEQAKDVLVKLSEWCLGLTDNLTDEQMQEMLISEHGGMNETFAYVASITKDKRYVRLAQRFSDRRILNPLLEGRDELNGLHANTQIPKVIGFYSVAQLTDEQEWAKAARFFWNTVVNKRTISIGGNSVREHFHPSDNFSSMLESVEGPETCNSYNMLKLSKQLFLTKPSPELIDYYERTLYNHILSSQHPQGGFVYFTPMRPRHYRVYSRVDEGFWCCVGSGLENHGKYGELVYAHNGEDLFVNLFIPSTLNWKEKGAKISQDTKFPFEEATEIKINLERKRLFTVYIRKPSWVKDSGFQVKVNGKRVAATEDVVSSYIAVERTWKNGDIVSVSLPMETTLEQMPDQSPWYSFVHGPIVLAAAVDSSGLDGLFADGSRMGHIAHGPLYPIDKAPLLVGEPAEILQSLRPVEGEPLTYNITNAYYPEHEGTLELKPFFQLHDARYMLYWMQTSPENLDSIVLKLQEEEQAMLELESRTIDKITPGEQQPESDHGFKGERTESGVFQDRHWRHARGWFSYNLKNPGKDAQTLRITYFGGDKGRSFDIYVNDKLLERVTAHAEGQDGFYDVDYELADGMTSDPVLNLKFVAQKGSVAGGVYYIRLLR